MRQPSSDNNRLSWLILASLLIVTALAYWPGTRGAWLLDDYPNLVRNTAFENLQPTWGSFLLASISSDSGPTHRPVSMASFALNVLAHGGGKKMRSDAAAMKWTNVGIHLLNGILIFILLRLILGQYRRLRPETSKRACEWAALLITGAWLLAPVNLTAVLYVIQRMTSLAGTFSLLGLIAFVSGRKRLYDKRQLKTAWILLFTAALICTPLAIFSKEIGALTMLYALVIEGTLFSLRQNDGSRATSVFLYFSVFLLIPAIAALTWLLPHELSASAWAARPFTLGERLLTEGRVVWHYVWWILVPDLGSLTLYHDSFPISHGLLQPWTTLPALIGLGAMLFTGIKVRRRYPLISLGLLWFIAGQVMTATFIPLELVYEHRQYLPSIGLYTAIFGTAMVLVNKPQHKRLAAISIAAIIALYGTALGLRSIDWSNPLRQLEVAARNHPDSPRATYGYARILTIYSQIDPKLLPDAFKALMKARNVPGHGVLPDATLIMLASRTGHHVNPDWYKQIAQVLARGPATPEEISGLNALVHCAIGNHAPCRLDPDLMQMIFAAALTPPHPSPTIMVIYGNYLLNAAGQPQKARKIFLFLVQRYPQTAAYHFNLGVTELACGNLTAARQQLESLRTLNRFGTSNEYIKSLSKLIKNVEENTPYHAQTQ